MTDKQNDDVKNILISYNIEKNRRISQSGSVDALQRHADFGDEQNLLCVTILRKLLNHISQDNHRTTYEITKNCGEKGD